MSGRSFLSDGSFKSEASGNDGDLTSNEGDLLLQAVTARSLPRSQQQSRPDLAGNSTPAWDVREPVAVQTGVPAGPYPGEWQPDPTYNRLEQHLHESADLPPFSFGAPRSGVLSVEAKISLTVLTDGACPRRWTFARVRMCVCAALCLLPRLSFFCSKSDVALLEPGLTARGRSASAATFCFQLAVHMFFPWSMPWYFYVLRKNKYGPGMQALMQGALLFAEVSNAT